MLPLLSRAWNIPAACFSPRDGQDDQDDQDEPSERIARFTSPLTRILLSSEGLTTTLLSALMGEPMRLYRLEQRRVLATEAGTGPVRLLELAAEEHVLLRRSVATRPGGILASMTHVVTRLDLEPGLAECFTGAAVAMDQALHAAGTGHRRTLLAAGCQPWPGGGPQRTACFKAYRLWHADQPLALVHELFNPELVPTAARGSGPAAASKAA